jgi:hypothetical protein
MGAQAAAALPILPLRADQRAEHKGGEQEDERVEKVRKCERANESNGIIAQLSEAESSACNPSS